MNQKRIKYNLLLYEVLVAVLIIRRCSQHVGNGQGIVQKYKFIVFSEYRLIVLSARTIYDIFENLRSE